MKRLILCVMCIAFLFSVCGTLLFSLCAAQAPKERGKITIAYIGIMTGIGGAFGEEQWAGMRLALDDINSAGGVRVGGKVYDFQGYAFDGEESAEKCMTRMNEAISLHHPLVIYGGSSMAAIPMKEFAKEKDFILLGNSEIPSFTQPRNPLCIRAWLKVVDQDIMLAYLRKLGVKKLATLATSTEVSVKWAQVCRDMWKKRGGTVVGEEIIFSTESTDFTGPVLKLLSYGPEAIAGGGHPDSRAASILKIAREQGFKGRFFFGSACRGPRMIKLIGKELAEGTILVGTGFERVSPKINEFKERISKLYPGKPYGFIFATGYEAPFWVKAGIEQAGTVTDKYKIVESLERADGRKTSPTGLWEKVINGEAQFSLSTMEIRNGEVVIIR
jgi:branched-chain amino acid transport system substrate-binding protein